MILLATSLLAAIAFALTIPSAVFAAEIYAALLGSRRFSERPPIGERNSQVAILVPAHNEAEGLLATLNDIRPQLRPTDRLLVVADNCTDKTAAVAVAGGAEVTVRSDPTRIGKGYALDWGLNVLAANPPETVVIIDADCKLAPSAIEYLIDASQKSHRPVQSLYLMRAPHNSTINHQVAEFAWRVKNWVRPLGLKALGMPCQLMGSGMAFPWAAIRSVDLSHGIIVEDLKLGLDLASNGHAPLFCPHSVVTSTFPSSAEGAMRQRQRWEHGHLSLVLKTALPRLTKAIRLRDMNSLVLALDLLVPPLSLFVAILTTATIGSAIAVLFGLSVVPFLISLSSFVVVILAVVFAWNWRGREILPARSLTQLLPYLATKARLYIAAVLGQRVSLWIRTDRN